MTDAIDQETYENEVNESAAFLLEGAHEMVETGDYDAVRDAILELASEEAEHHNWFARSYYDGALYGSIVEHRMGETERYTDWMALIESNDPETTLKRLGYVVFEADITDAALSAHESAKQGDAVPDPLSDVADRYYE